MSDMLKNRGVWLALGVAIGLVLSGVWPDAPAHATATAQQDNFAIATGPVSGSTEAIFFLDSLTGDLKAAVLSPQNGKFLSVFSYNVLGDFALDPAKNPKFLMVTGVNDFRRFAGDVQLGSAVCYVAEVGSGKVAAYGMPWSRQRDTSTQAAAAPLVPLDVLQFRNVAVRDE